MQGGFMIEPGGMKIDPICGIKGWRLHPEIQNKQMQMRSKYADYKIG